MKITTTKVNGFDIPTYSLNTVIVGTGASGYNAADCLWNYGQRDIAIVTENINAGTSRNTGSDKQTYYKLTLSGGDSDSVREMTDTLFSGLGMDGDHALCEAALSSQGFLRLVDLGVQFPRNRYGEFIGYKTDHDPRRRATSVGPYTSKMMTEKLQKSVENKEIKTFDKMQVIKILTTTDIVNDAENSKTSSFQAPVNTGVEGLLCLDLSKIESENPFVLFKSPNVIYATGGPGGIYSNSVFPHSHLGATGIAFEAGVKGKNLTEWQYGMASTFPRWNVSGSYMQVLPKFVSTEQDGSDAKEFLYNFFEDEANMLNMIFLKGYQWPFDVRKVNGGSSIIDILVYMESAKGRKVYLDFRQNPGDKVINFETLSAETYEYLKNGGACFGTPIERLKHMNRPAVDFYNDKGVDIETEMLEIAVCAQHNNGGLDIDCWWQTNVTGFFAVGEVAATHGVYRPGGSALNSGQVGSIRAAQYIAKRRGEIVVRTWSKEALKKIEESFDFLASITSDSDDTLTKLWEHSTKRMSRFGGPIRNAEDIKKCIMAVEQERSSFLSDVKVGVSNRHKAFRLWDILGCQEMYLKAMNNYIKEGGKSRGSALYTDSSVKKYYDKLPDTFSFKLDQETKGNVVQELNLIQGVVNYNWRSVRPIPIDDDFFENVWRKYREDENIY